MVSLMNDGHHHSMCRSCWNERRPNASSHGHETLPRFRAQEVCCFCLREHKSGIHVAKNPNSKELNCGNRHGSLSKERKMTLGAAR